ncbi:MAG TPA: hypothetical protein VHU23_13115 [Rhizomicrobium sp.]|jgi:hypothetical protein|nr:hypothetical protein [Rhizomicrobium sp.]
MAENSSEDVYQQDCENYRYQDRSKWSRFQTASVVQGAVVYAVFALNKLSSIERVGVAIAGALFVLTICGLAWKDGLDAGIYLDRMIAYERSRHAHWKGGRAKWGKRLLFVQITLVALFNIWMILKVTGDFVHSLGNVS